MKHLSVLLLSPYLISCGSFGVKGLPVYNGKLWAGNSSSAEIRRTQDPAPNSISAFDKQFDNYTCLTYEDLSCLYFTFLQNSVGWYTLHPSCPKVDPAQMRSLIPKMEKEIKAQLGAEEDTEPKCTPQMGPIKRLGDC